MIIFPLDPVLAKIIISGEKMGCICEVLTIVSMLSVPNIFNRQIDRAEESDVTREKFFVLDSDHLSLLNLYLQWKNNKNSSSWCSENYLDLRVLKKSMEIQKQLVDIIKQIKMTLNSCAY